MNQSMAVNGTKLSQRQIWLYAFPALPHAFIALPLHMVVPSFYAAHTTVTLAQIALITTLSRLLDAILDPLIGMLSDRTRTRLGRRKPWVLAGGLVCSVAILFMFQPPTGSGMLYFACWSFLLYLGFSFFEIPRGAWATELSRNYLERAHIQSSVATFNVIGSLVFWLMPLALASFTGTFAITGATLTGIAWLYGLLMPAGILLSLWFVPNGDVPQDAAATFRDFLRTVRHNRPLWIFLALMVCWGLGQGMYLSTIFIFVQDYLQLGDIFPVLMILYFVVQIGALPVWLRITRRIGKHRAWAIGMVCDVLTRPLILLFANGSETPMAAMIAIILIGAFFGASGIAAPASILGDVVDYDLMKTRVNKAGRFFAFQILLTKATMALGAGAGFMLLDKVGYKVGETANTATANGGLIAAYLVIPALFWIAAASVAWRFPITAARHNIIRQRMERRERLAMT